MWKWIAVITLAMIGQSWAQEYCSVCSPTPLPPGMSGSQSQAAIEAEANRERQELMQQQMQQQIDQQQQDIERLQQQQQFNDPYP